MIFRDDAPADGNGNLPAPAPAPSHPAPPPSSTIVVTGEKTEREIELEGLLESARAEAEIARTERGSEQSRRKKLEKDIAYLQDELAKLRQVPAPPNPEKKSFWDEFYSAD